MLLKVLARTGLALMVSALLTTGGCRSNTDRIRVLEAERAAAERDNQKSKEDLATMRAQLLEEQHRAERAEAEKQAADARLAVIRDRSSDNPGVDDGAGDSTIDADGMDKRLGPDVKVRETADGAKIVLASDITFRAGRADLNRSAQSTLKRVAQEIAGQGVVRAIRIEGHTDSDPIRKSGWRDNEELSLARAQQVQRYLVANGISEDLLSVDGLGAKRPLESNSTKNGKARNRRVEIVLVTR